MNTMEGPKDGYEVKRLDLIPNYQDNPTAIDYLVDILTPAAKKLKRVDIMKSKGISDSKLDKIYKDGYTTCIVYRAYLSKDEDVQFEHLENDSDTFLGFPHMVIVEVQDEDGNTTSKVSDIEE